MADFDSNSNQEVRANPRRLYRVENDKGPRWRWWFWSAAVLLVGCVVVFFDLRSHRTLGSHESFVAVPVREMLTTGDWVVPRYGGVPRLQKPPLVYWIAATTSRVVGEVNEFTVRFHSAIASLLLAGVVAIWAYRWYGTTAALCAAIIQTTAFYVINYGRRAEVDMVLCLLTTSALFLIANQTADEPSRQRFWRWAAIYTLLGLSWLGKFHYGLTMVMAPCLAYWIVERRWRAFLQLMNPLGIMIFLACVLVWPLMVLRQLPDAWNIWQSETIGRAMGEFDREPLLYYIPHLITSTFPWITFVVESIPESWSKAWKQRDTRERFLWIWLVTHFLILSASASKHPNYAIATIPMLTLLGCQGMSRMVFRARNNFAPLTLRTSLALAIAAALCTGTMAFKFANDLPHLSHDLVVISVTAIAGTTVILLLLAQPKMLLTSVAAAGAFVTCFIMVNKWIIPVQDHRFADSQFGRESRAMIADDEEIIVYRTDEAHNNMDPIVFYLGQPVSRIETPTELQTRLNDDSMLHIVAYNSWLDELESVGRVTQMRTMTASTYRGASRRHPPFVLIQLQPHDEPDKPESVPGAVPQLANEPSDSTQR